MRNFPLRRLLIPAIMSVVITACSVMDVLKPVAKEALGANDGISVDAQIGDRENSAHIDTGDKNTVSANKVEGGVNYIEEGPSPFMILLLILGWILPDPLRMWNGIKLLPKWFRRK